MKKRVVALLLITLLTSCLGILLLPEGSRDVRYVSAKTNRKYTMNKGETHTFHYNHKVKKWRSSNKQVATVSRKGRVKAKHVGKAVITASCGKWKRKITVTVKKKATKQNTTGKESTSAKNPSSKNNNVAKIQLKGETRGVVTELTWTMPALSNYSGGTAKIYRSQGDAEHYQVIAGAELHVSEGEDYSYKDTDTSLHLNTIYYYKVCVYSYKNETIASSGDLKSSLTNWRYFSDSMELAGDTYYDWWSKTEYTVAPTEERWYYPDRIGAGNKVEYYAGGKYQFFTGTFGVSADSDCHCRKRVKIYADDVLVTTTEWFSYLSNPIAVLVDIDYANTIRIQAEYGSEHYDEDDYRICDEYWEDVLLNQGKFCN